MFPKGFKVFKPSDKAPDFVKVNIVIDHEFLQWFNENQHEGEVRVDIKESKNGKYYPQRNDFKSSGGQSV